MTANPRGLWQIWLVALVTIAAALAANTIWVGHSPMVEAPLKTLKLIEEFIK